MTTTIRRASPLVTVFDVSVGHEICSTATSTSGAFNSQHQCDEQDYTLQLLSTVQRDALRHATGATQLR